jgi:Tol biopolymer transport system component
MGHCFGKTGPLYVADVDGSDLVELRVPSGVDNSGKPFDAEPVGVKWSPDGTTLLYTLTAGLPFSNMQDLFLHDVASDETGTLVDFGLQDTSFYGLGGFDFSPDGGTVIYSRPRQPAPCGEPNPEFPCTEPTNFDLWSVPITGGDPTLVLRDAGVPGYLADGQEIAFVEVGMYAEDGGSISIVANGDRRSLASTLPDLWAMEMSPDRSQILYRSGEGIAVVDVATGDTSRVYGNYATWFGDDRLLVGCVPNAPAPDEEPTVDTCS